jgi:serine protease Do
MALSNKSFVSGALIGAGVAAAGLGGAVFGMRLDDAPQLQAQAPLQGGLIKASTAPIFAPPPGAPLSFADIFERVSPAVVSIDVRTRVNLRAFRRLPGLESFPFAVPPQAPGGEDGQPGDNDGDNRPEAQASGSGFLISADGYIVTNNHVVADAEEITVRLKDERELKARVIGRDEATDLAVIKIEGQNFPFVRFEDAATAQPRVGDWVITVGNPFGLGGTATAGIVSAYGRDIGETFTDYIQIDAPINRGNSGGPTFDTFGRVIGVNTAIFSPSGGSVGIGFAIPADLADTVVRQLISGGRVTRGYLGVTIQTLTPEVAESQGLGTSQKGALIADVTPGGPGARGGLRQGDVVLRVNGKEVEDNTDLTRTVAAARAGESLRLEVLREGRRQTLTVTSGTRPAEAELNANRRGQGATPDAPSAPATPAAPIALGLSLAPLDEAARRQYGLGPETRGVVITAVRSGSDAASKGLRRGDVIVSVNFRAVSTPQEVAAAVAAQRQAGRQNVTLAVTRRGQSSPAFIGVKIAD